MSNIRAGIAQFLKSRTEESPFLIPLWTPELETQILVHKGTNEVDPNVYEADGEKWTNHRWPYKASSDPQYSDRKLTYDPAKRVARIGSTWWNWERRESLAVAFDIDAEDSGHAAGTNQLDEFKLGQVVAKLSDLEYVSIIRSTGGKGVHGYIFFDPDDRPQTNNHNEHTQVCLAVIEKIKADTGMDLIEEKIVDAKGLVLWLWASTSNKDHIGFTAIKEATKNLRNEDLADWTHITTAKKVTSVKGNYEQCELTEEHIEVLSQLEDLGYAYRWNAEHNTAQTHTYALKILQEKRKNEGNPLKGLFETNSEGNDPSSPNCYITAKPGGMFKVTRYGNGTQEHRLWLSKDDDTWCFYNQELDPFAVLQRYAMTFDMSSATLGHEEFAEALEILGVEFEFPKVQIKATYDSGNNSIVVKARHSENEGVPSGWTKVGKQITARLPIDGSPETRTTNYLDEIDDSFRFVIQPDFSPCGWFHKSSRGWIKYDGVGQIARLISQQFGKQAADEVIAMMQNNPWMLGNYPFGPSELPERTWNRCLARFACEPSEVHGPHPHFDKIFDHLGKGLDQAVWDAEWASEWGLEGGADYLRYWVASAVKHPYEPLPYLFFFGQQGCGKSIFVEMLKMLFPDSAGEISQAVLSESGFNGEALGKVFCYIEEKDLTGKQAQRAYERIKEWVMAKEISIHPKGKTPYMTRNTSKFIHFANNINSIKIDRDDTRVVAVDVGKLHNPIPKTIMENRLEEEIPFFLRTLMTTEIPPAVERCRVPHINTVAKMELGECNMSVVQKFAQDQLKPCPGNVIEFKDFKSRFDTFCGVKNISVMGMNAISSELRKMEDLLVLGKYGNTNKVHIGNVKFADSSVTGGKVLHLQSNGRIS